MSKKLKSEDTEFSFKMTARQAQTLFSVCACMMEERQLFWQIWSSDQRRKDVRAAFRRFSRQLNQEYARTGAEVWPRKP